MGLQLPIIFLCPHAYCQKAWPSHAGGLTITRNLGAWSQVANMLYIDSPAGVGLSVAAHSEDTVTNDTQTATDTSAFLRKWFRKYEAFQKHNFFISGVYIFAIVRVHVCKKALHQAVAAHSHDHATCILRGVLRRCVRSHPGGGSAEGQCTWRITPHQLAGNSARSRSCHCVCIRHTTSHPVLAVGKKLALHYWCTAGVYCGQRCHGPRD